MAGTVIAETGVGDEGRVPIPPRAGFGRIAGGLLLALLSGAMLFSTWEQRGNLWPLVVVAFVPMFVAAYRVLPPRLSAVAFGIAAAGYYLALGLDGDSVLPMAVVAAISVTMGLLWTLATIWERSFSRRTGYALFVVQFAVLWVALDLLAQGNPITGSNLWLAYRLAPVPALDQPVSVLSTPALTFLVIMINAAIALGLMTLMDRRWPQLAEVPLERRVVGWSVGTTAVVTVAWLVGSLALYAQVSASMGPTVRVAAVQSGIKNTTVGDPTIGGPQGTPRDIARNARLRQELTQMTLQAAEQGAQLAVWPEEELNYDVRIDGKGDWVAELAERAGLTIVSGFMPEAPSLASPNLAAVWYPDGRMSPQIYAKVHPVIAEGEAFEPGTLAQVYPTDFGELGVVICFDHDHPDSTIRTTVAAGATIMAVPALDPASVARTRWQSLTFRAIELRVPMVKTDVGYDSAIINANGDLVERVGVTNPASEIDLLVGDVDLGPRNSPFIQYGSYPFMLVVILALIGRIVLQVILWRRAGPSTVVRVGPGRLGE